MSDWEAAVESAGGTTPIDLSNHIRELESRLPSLQAFSDMETQNCSCSQTKYCENVKDYPEQELMGYGAGDWQDFMQLSPVPTTIVLGAYSDSTWSQDLICTAHASKTRVLLDNPSGVTGEFDTNTTFDNATAVADWIIAKIEDVARKFADGFVIDEEDKFPSSYASEMAKSYSALVALTTATIQAVRPGSSIGVATAWSPMGIDLRYYDFPGLAFGSTFFWVMGYSVQSQNFDRCVACGNTVTQLQHGLVQFMALGVPARKLVLGVAWGGTIWECKNYDGTNNDLDFCEPYLVGGAGYRGVNCSDLVSSSCGDLTGCWSLESSRVSNIRWDNYVKLPYFNFLENNTLKQVWYETPRSLGHKYSMAKDLGILGVGPWEFGKLNYSHPAQIKEVWSEFCKFFEC